MSRPLVTIGADPELFLGKHNGELASAIDRIGGYKSAPRSLSRTGYFVQEDNVAVEFNIPPATSLEEFVGSIQWAVKEITDEVKPMGLEPYVIASALFPQEELEDARAQEFGCDPDYNAWKGGQTNPRPNCTEKRLRTCGGHVHVGYPIGTDIDRLRIIQMMDLYLGVPSVLMDDDQERRVLYGKAGAFRPTDYGVEYRVLSNFWLKKPEYMEWVYTQTQRAFDKALEFGGAKPAVDKEGKRDPYYPFMEKFDLCDDIQNCINYGSPEIAQRLIATHDLQMVV